MPTASIIYKCANIYYKVSYGFSWASKAVFSAKRSRPNQHFQTTNIHYSHISVGKSHCAKHNKLPLPSLCHAKLLFVLSKNNNLVSIFFLSKYNFGNMTLKKELEMLLSDYECKELCWKIPTNSALCSSIPSPGKRGVMSYKMTD